VVVLVQHKIDDIGARLRDLRAMRSALAKLRKGCTDGAAPINHCPIIESLTH
jgi:hypothetical protein